MSTLSIMERIPDEASAYEYLETLRWKGEPVCPHCGNRERIYFLNPANGPRKTSTGADTARRLWKCGECRRKFSVLTGSVMHGTKIPVRTWILVIHEMASAKNGIASREIERRYNLTPKSAWFLLHRIREAMKDDGLTVFRGVVVADETYIGGAYPNMHRSKVKARTETGAAYNKTPVLTLIDTESGQVRSRVLPRVTAATLRKAIAEQTDLPSTVLHTDRSASYIDVSREVAAHHAVDHKAGEYVRNGVSTNKCENFFGQLKRSISGTHHHVSREHLGRYLSEFDYRFSTRKMSDTERTRDLLSKVDGKRLTYRAVVA
jgi:transposase-like protein